MVIDERVGSAELDVLADALAPPCQLGDYLLEGLISKTTTALVFVVRGGIFGDSEGVLKLTGRAYAPLLDRELRLLNACRAADLHSVVQPVRSELQWIEQQGGSVAAVPLPFLAGGNLVQWIGDHATRHGQLGPRLALEIGELVAGVVRALLRLPKPIVYGDVKPQNVLLPRPDAPLSDLTLIDFDAAQELELDLDDLTNAPRLVAQLLIADVNGFGELLYMLATGREPAVEGTPDPATGNHPFDALIVNCLTSNPDGSGYVCLADNGLWRDLEKALTFERTRRRPPPGVRWLLSRPVLGGVAVVLMALLALAVAAKLPLFT